MNEKVTRNREERDAYAAVRGGRKANVKNPFSKVSKVH